MIDKKWIGHELPPSELSLDHTRLRFFAKAIGETSDIYTDGVYLTAQTLPLLQPGSFVRSLSEIRNYPR